MFNPNDRLRLMRVEAMLAVLLAKESETMASVQDLDAAVAELTTAVDNAVNVIGQAGSGINPADLDHVASDIKAQTDRLTQAVADAVQKAHAAGM